MTASFLILFPDIPVKVEVRIFMGCKKGPHLGASKGSHDPLHRLSVHNQHVRARVRGDAGRFDLGTHASRSHIGGGTGFSHLKQGIIDIGYVADEGGLRVPVGVIRIKTVDIAQKDHQIRTGDGSHKGCQPVVIPEGDLRGGDRIVFVDDGDGV